MKEKRQWVKGTLSIPRVIPSITKKAWNWVGLFTLNASDSVEDFIGTKISSISTSPERDDTILVENPFEI